MIITRAFFLWCAIIPLAIANGFFRDSMLTPRLGPAPARFCSGLILCVVIFAWTLLTIPWLTTRSLSGYAAIGACWLALTITFEFAFGRLVAKHSWDQLLRPYRFADGDIWPIVLVVVAVSPLLAALLRHHE